MLLKFYGPPQLAGTQKYWGALLDSAIGGGTLEDEEAPEGFLRQSCGARPTSIVNHPLSYCYETEK